MNKSKQWWFWEAVFWCCVVVACLIEPNLPAWKAVLLGASLGLCYKAGRKHANQTVASPTTKLKGDRP